MVLLTTHIMAIDSLDELYKAMAEAGSQMSLAHCGDKKGYDEISRQPLYTETYGYGNTRVRVYYDVYYKCRGNHKTFRQRISE